MSEELGKLTRKAMAPYLAQHMKDSETFILYLMKDRLAPVVSPWRKLLWRIGFTTAKGRAIRAWDALRGKEDD